MPARLATQAPGALSDLSLRCLCLLWLEDVTHLLLSPWSIQVSSFGRFEGSRVLPLVTPLLTHARQARYPGAGSLIRPLSSVVVLGMVGGCYSLTSQSLVYPAFEFWPLRRQSSFTPNNHLPPGAPGSLPSHLDPYLTSLFGVCACYGWRMLLTYFSVPGLPSLRVLAALRTVQLYP
jgi:hypothetical protein